jgi:hypothetical protein
MKILTTTEMCDVVDLAKQEILSLRASNAELLAALKRAERDLAVIVEDDRCKIDASFPLATVRVAIAKAEGRS